jgi:immune inhibitor A
MNDIFVLGENKLYKSDNHPHLRMASPALLKKYKITQKVKNGELSLYDVNKEDIISPRAFTAFSNIMLRQSKLYEKILPTIQSRTSTVPSTIQTASKKNIVVLLVEFNDQPRNLEKAHFEEILFKKNGNSVYDYFQEVSYGQLFIKGEVSNWFKADGSYVDYLDSYVDQNGQAHGDVLHMPQAKKLVQETISKALKTNKINFSDYSNQTGVLDTVIIVFAGLGGNRPDGTFNSGGNTYINIYPHRGSNLYLNDVADYQKVNNYILTHELPKNDIGGYCHEIAHTLGLPDLYCALKIPNGGSSSGTVSSVVGGWCLMGCGDYNNGGATPSHLSAWCKIQLGWANPQIITGKPQNYEIDAASDSSNNFYKITVPENFGSGAGEEYFLLENRQKQKFDEKLPGSGLLIWHVNENYWHDKDPNQDLNNPFLTLVQPDGLMELEKPAVKYVNGVQVTNRDCVGDLGDVFPFGNNKSFTNTSQPSSKTQRGNNSCVSITNISDSDKVMTAIIGLTCQDGPIITQKKDLEQIEELKVKLRKEKAVGRYQEGYISGYISGYKEAFKLEK